MYKLCFFVPESHLSEVKTALFEVGVGKIGNYDQCCWQTKGIGQFRPLAGSAPAIGDQDQLEQLDEWKVEMVCDDALIRQAVAALLLAHPYEEVAYETWQVNQLPE